MRLIFEVGLLTDSPGNGLQCIFSPRLSEVTSHGEVYAEVHQGFQIPSLESHCGLGFSLPTEIAKNSINQP